MTTNCINRSVLALMAAVAIFAGTTQAGEAGQTRPFQNLVTDDAALEAWLTIGPPQPDIILEGTPVNEVARETASIFKNQFDLILPPADPDLPTMAVQMRLRDVRAIQVFNAMNLYFEVQKLPARWKLTLNGTRPTAILAMEQLQVAATPLAETEKMRNTVFSIADILSASSPAPDKQTADSLAQAITAVLNDLQKPGHAKVNAPGGPIIKVHAQAGILVLRVTWEETELVRCTLAALKDAAISRSNKARELELRAKDEAARKASEDYKNKAPENLKKDGGATGWRA